MNDLVALQSISKELAQSRLHAHRNPADVLFVISVGETLGLNAATALMNIYNINGRPTIKADLKLALAKRHPEYAGCEIDSNTERCIVKMKRRNENGTEESIISTFTIDDAKRAGLFPKKDNWRMYPQRMLKARAISYAVNDLFPDIVLGMLSSEEAQDIDRHTEKLWQNMKSSKAKQKQQIGRKQKQQISRSKQMMSLPNLWRRHKASCETLWITKLTALIMKFAGIRASKNI